MSEELQLALLGNVELRRDDLPVTGVNSNKVRALLCYLAVTGRPHSRPTLAGLLWGELPEANAQNNLRKALSNLRQVVGAHLDITRQEVAFDRDAPYWLDVEAFEGLLGGASTQTDVERLQEAVELYRGDFLEGFYVRRAPAFEEWATVQRERYRRQALEGLEALVSHHLAVGDYAAAEAAARRQLEIDDLRESAWRGLMEALARDGQRNQALAEYEKCRQLLQAELGVAPAAETTALYEGIRLEELKVATSATVPETEIPLRRPSFLDDGATPVHGRRSVFVARERELGQLEAFLQTARRGQGQVVFVTGGPGRGKTALLQEFALRGMQAHRDLLVATGNCNAFSGLPRDIGRPHRGRRSPLEGRRHHPRPRPSPLERAARGHPGVAGSRPARGPRLASRPGLALPRHGRRPGRRALAAALARTGRTRTTRGRGPGTEPPLPAGHPRLARPGGDPSAAAYPGRPAVGRHRLHRAVVPPGKAAGQRSPLDRLRLPA
jgi:DNA-binding SARP family transcriptional activator